MISELPAPSGGARQAWGFRWALRFLVVRITAAVNRVCSGSAYGQGQDGVARNAESMRVINSCTSVLLRAGSSDSAM